MFIKVLKFCIFAISIFSTKGFLQENISPASNLATSSGPPGDVPPDNVVLEDDPPDTKTPADEDADDNKQPVSDEDNNEQQAGDEDNNDQPADEEDNNEQPAGDEDYNEQPTGDKGNSDNNEPENPAPLGFPIDKGYPDYYMAPPPKYKEIYKYPFKLPKPNESLDRNKPEAGFDLTREEMMKLKLWPDALIPYYIDVHSYSDKVLRDKIRSFLSSVNSLTSLNFVELPSPPNDNSRWVFFINRRGLLGCADHSIKNFTNTGVQHVILGYHCMSTEGELAEVVLAIAGVPAQHNAPDRDYYIKINEENIIPEKKYLFDKHFDDEWLFHDLEYDFKSAGHFHSYKHSINGRATIELQKKTVDIVIGESKTLSAIDIQKIRMLYNYIVKKKLLQAPDCHKLFEPGKKFSQFKPSDDDLKPRPKPYKYTGEASDASLVKDDDEKIIATSINSDQDQNINDNVLPNPESDPNANYENESNANNNETNYPDDNQLPNEIESPDYYKIRDEINDQNQTPNEINTLPESDADYNEQQPEYEYKDNGQENNELPQKDTPIPENSYNKETEESENFSPSEYHVREKKPTIVNIGKGHIQNLKLQKKDPVSYLSDFNTDYDIDRRHTKVKKNRLKAPLKNDFFKSHPKLELKFKGLG